MQTFEEIYAESGDAEAEVLHTVAKLQVSP